MSTADAEITLPLCCRAATAIEGSLYKPGAGQHTVPHASRAGIFRLLMLRLSGSFDLIFPNPLSI